MDPNPNKFPILSFVISKLPITRSHSPEFDIEQPQSPAKSSPEPYFEITDRMPHLNDPDLIAAMRATVADVSKTRSALKILGDCPDHELVDIARLKLIELRNGNVDDVSVDIENNDDNDTEEIRSLKAVISLYEMYKSYEKMLSEAEVRLEKLYEAAIKGGKAVVEDEEGSSSVEVDDELVGMVNDALVKGVDRIDLSDRKLPFLPETVGKLHKLVSLKLSSNLFNFSLPSYAFTI